MSEYHSSLYNLEFRPVAYRRSFEWGIVKKFSGKFKQGIIVIKLMIIMIITPFTEKPGSCQ